MWRNDLKMTEIYYPSIDDNNKVTEDFLQTHHNVITSNSIDTKYYEKYLIVTSASPNAIH